MKTVRGDLIKMAQAGEFDVIVHGCNCFHTMGAGIAKGIAAKFPEALAADKTTTYGAPDKLGTVSVAHIDNLVVVNAYTQFQWKGRGRKADYDAIKSCFEDIATRFSNSRIGYPMIGAGLAGGDWVLIAELIETALIGCDHTLVEFAG